MAVDYSRTRTTGLGSVFEAVKFADDVEGGDESDEAEAHDQNHGGADLQPRRVVGVEPEHIAAAAAAQAGGAGVGRRGPAYQPPTTHTGGRRRRAARGHGAAAGGGRLRLGGASRHG